VWQRDDLLFCPLPPHTTTLPLRRADVLIQSPGAQLHDTSRAFHMVRHPLLGTRAMVVHREHGQEGERVSLTRELALLAELHHPHVAEVRRDMRPMRRSTDMCGPTERCAPT
jgi:hypothetical protein